MEQKQKRVCIVTSVHNVVDNRIFHKEAQSLRKAGYRVTLIAQHDKDESIEGIHIIGLKKRKNKLARMARTPFEAYRIALKEKADIYHFHDGELIPFMALLKRRRAAKVIYDVHEMQAYFILTKEWIPRLLRSVFALLFDIIEKTLSRFFDSIVAATEEIALEFARKGFTNVTTIHNYPVLTVFEQRGKKKKFNRRLIYVGDLTEVRGIKNIIEAMRHVTKEITLTLIGRVSDKQLEKTFDNLPQNVDFKGWLSPSEAYREMMDADIGIICFFPIPHHVQALPNKLFEYMAAGLCIISSNFPLWEKIVEGNNCGRVVDPLVPQDIADVISSLIDNPQEVLSTGETGRRLAFKKYRWEHEEKKLCRLYKRLLND